MQCGPGTYADTPGLTACSACPLGSYTVNTGSTSASACIPCAAGFAQVNGEGTPCQPCPPGTYMPYVPASQRNASLAVCVPCPPNTYSTAAGAASLDTCRPCPPGSTSDAGAYAPALCAQAPYSPPPKSAWERVSSVVIPVASVVGAVVTYAAVGDRLLAGCFPSAHRAAWHWVAVFLATAVAPCVGVCFLCCRAKAHAAVEGAAAALLARLDLMDDARKKAAVARRKLASSTATDFPAEAEENENAGVNPLRKAREPALATSGSPKNDAADDASQWQRRSDEAGDVWYVHAVTGESSWTPSPGRRKKSASARRKLGNSVASDMPAGAEEGVSATVRQVREPALATSGAPKEATADDAAQWQQQSDGAGNVWYVHAVTGESSWTPGSAAST